MGVVGGLASERWLRAFMGRERRVEKKEGMEGGREGIKIGVQLLLPGLRTLECSPILKRDIQVFVACYCATDDSSQTFKRLGSGEPV